jgi:hypothetical protein
LLKARIFDNTGIIDIFLIYVRKNLRQDGPASNNLYEHPQHHRFKGGIDHEFDSSH